MMRLADQVGVLKRIGVGETSAEGGTQTERGAYWLVTEDLQLLWRIVTFVAVWSCVADG